MSAIPIDISKRMFLAKAALSALTIVAGVPTARGSSTRVVRPEDFGGAARPGFDNSASLRRALGDAARDGATVTLGPGIYEVNSTALLRSGAIVRPAGVPLVGAGADMTELHVSGRSVINQLFRIDNSSNVRTAGIRFVGNGIKDDSAPYAGALMSAILGPNANSGMSDIVIEDCEIDNFASATWFLVRNASPRFAVERVGSRNCRWISRANTAPQAGRVTVPGHFLYFEGERGPIRDVSVADSLMDAMHIKGGVALVGNIEGGSVNVASLANAGQAIGAMRTDPEGPGAYAIMLYQHPNGAPRNLAVSIGRLERAESVGVYAVGAQSSTVHVGFASGQRDTRDSTLFKGVLVLAGCRAVDAVIDRVEDCNRVVMISIDGGQNLGRSAEDAQISVQLGSVASRTGATDITIDAGGSPVAGGVRISGSRSGPAAVGIQVRSGPKTLLRNIDLAGLQSAGAIEPVRTGPGNVDLPSVSLPR